MGTPSRELPVETILILAQDSKVVYIPVGYVNAIESLQRDSKLISFSTLPLCNVSNDDFRYPTDYGIIKEFIYSYLKKAVLNKAIFRKL
ncbi:hypothetical protein [Flavobacterium hydatis]|uniref:Uncharacterized protein n=1 Tax=Flavobacterium hydatis TaxID=991 RepID=A0ABX4CL58_FLAHY|nr:hypothetical protein [Flavobacterium hydatis]OXA96985.1 hypothetical protein B0A62_06970 [Flavobacterium hydatis]